MIKKMLALIVALSFIFLFSSCSYAVISGSAKSNGAEKETDTEVINLIPPVSEAAEKAPPEKVTEAADEALEIKPEYLEAWDKNDELVGRIYIENTNINQYVFFTDNNDYYLSHDIDGNEDKYGSVFMDQINHGVLLDKNVILHGHNFNDGKMFFEIVKYKNQQFYEEHKIINFNTLYHDYTWEVFAAYTTTAEDYYIQTNFKTDEEFYDYVDNIISKSLIKTDYKPYKTDNLLTIHTCSYEFKDAHTMVYAYLKEKD